jgi:hypothetical protein
MKKGMSIINAPGAAGHMGCLNPSVLILSEKRMITRWKIQVAGELD